MAVCSAVQEAIYLRTIIQELGIVIDRPTRIWMDNQSAIKLGENAFSNKRAKHIDIRYHFTREKIAEGVIELKYVKTSRMVADVLTKGVAPAVVRMANESMFGTQLQSPAGLRESIGDHPCGDQGASAYLASSTHTSMVLDMGIDQVNGNMDTNLR